MEIWAFFASSACGPCLLAPVLLRVPAWLLPCAFHWTSYLCSPSGLCATLAAMANARDVISIYPADPGPDRWPGLAPVKLTPPPPVPCGKNDAVVTPSWRRQGPARTLASPRGRPPLVCGGRAQPPPLLPGPAARGWRSRHWWGRWKVPEARPRGRRVGLQARACAARTATFEDLLLRISLLYRRAVLRFLQDAERVCSRTPGLGNLPLTASRGQRLGQEHARGRSEDSAAGPG